MPRSNAKKPNGKATKRAVNKGRPQDRPPGPQATPGPSMNGKEPFVPRDKVVFASPLPGAPPKPAVPIADCDEMYMVGLFQNEGGYRRYLCIEETDTHVHLLHVPTLEHVEMTINQLRGCRVDQDHVLADMADRLHDKAAQRDLYGLRYSRALVNKALLKLKAKPLPKPPEVPEFLRPKIVPKPAPVGKVREFEAPPKPRLLTKPETRTPKMPSGGGVTGRAGEIAKLLLRPIGCTRQEILDLTGWASVSVQQQARTAGIGLRIEGTRGNMRYFGVEGGK